MDRSGKTFKGTGVPWSAAAVAVQRHFAATSVGAVAAFAALVGLLHVVKPELDPSWRFLSEYSIGHHGWAMTAAFFAWALSCFALFATLRKDLGTRSGRVGNVAIAVVGVSLVAAGLFDQDPVTAKPDELTTHGTVHGVASMIGIPGIPIAALLITWSLTHHNMAWLPWRRALMGMAHLTWLSLLVMVVYLAVAVPRAGGFGPEVWAGWMNRAVVATYCVWQLATSYVAYRIHARNGPTARRRVGDDRTQATGLVAERKDGAMRFMMLVKADANYEAGIPPSPALMAAIGTLSAEMANTGVLVEQGGLLPSAAGARIQAAGGRLTVTDGPFTEAKELIGGYAILHASSKAEAIELGRRFLQAHIDALGSSYEGQLEVRQLFDAPSTS